MRSIILDPLCCVLYDRLGKNDLAKKLRKDAANLFWQFNEKFWRRTRSFMPRRWTLQAIAT
jgi:hypothetical protein